MKAWERIKDGLDELAWQVESRTSQTDFIRGELSGAPAPPQSHPTPPQGWGAGNTPSGPKRRRPPGTGEIDLHLRLPARYRQRLEVLRRDRGLSLTATLTELVRRGLDEPPPPRLGRPVRREVRPGLVEEASLAALLAIEHTRLTIEASMPVTGRLAETIVAAAAVAAEDRMATAARALGEPMS